MAGIKLHAAIDVTIGRNHIYRTVRGIWLDWMAQGTRVTGNLMRENSGEDLFLEVNHGPFVVDNNLFLSKVAVRDMSEGGAFAHNLFGGTIMTAPEPGRKTPFHPAHSTVVAGLATTRGGDDRFFNNLFFGSGKKEAGRQRWVNGSGLWVYDERELPLLTSGNVYAGGALPYAKEVDPVVVRDGKISVSSAGDGGDVAVQIEVDAAWKQAKTMTVTAQLLDKAKVAGVGYENADGSAVRIDGDYFGKPRSGANPAPGPFASFDGGAVGIKVWGAR
jgi:hypothetical protein